MRFVAIWGRELSMRILPGLMATFLLMAALSGCGACAAGGDRSTQNVFCRVFDANF